MEGFQINYTDIYDLFWEYKTNLENLMNKIDTCENCINFDLKLDMNFDYLFRSSYMPV